MGLQVFIEAGCYGCHRAEEIAAEVSRRFPVLEVTVTDIAETSDEVPDSVFAVPTYLLEGATVSLGNPDLEELAAMIESALGSGAIQQGHS